MLSLTSFSGNNSESENKVIDDAEKTNLVFTFIAEYKTAVVEGVKDSSIAEVKIPSKVEFEGNIYMVTEIRLGAFYGCKNLKSAHVPKDCEVRDFAFPSTCKIEYY